MRNVVAMALALGSVSRPSEQAVQQQQVGYPRIIGDYPGGYYPGTGMSPEAVAGYIAGAQGGFPMLPGMPHIPVRGAPHPMVSSAPWRAMQAPGSPPLGEGHVPLPLNPETNTGIWGNTTAGGAAVGATITFSARPQKPFKVARIVIFGSKTGGAVSAHMVGQVFIGTDLQQGEVGNIDLETIGGGGAFDTWLSFKQAEPGVWIRVLASLLGPPTFTAGTDQAQYVVTAIGHYLH